MTIGRVPVLGKTQQIHFIGIGGTGMSGIAEVLINLGYRVTGSDQVRNAAVQRIESIGGRVFLGHHSDHIGDACVVVVSSAVRSDNVELQEARRRQIPTIPRAEMLGELMRMKFSIAIAGSHGKTSTTSMVAQVVSDAGLDPTIVLGGRLGVIGSGAKLGKGHYLVAEADESDGSFLRLSPTVAVVTNIDAEHLDHYGRLEDLRDAFVDFMNRVPFYGSIVVCMDDPNLHDLLPRLERRHITYGFGDGADLCALEPRFTANRSEFQARFRGETLGAVRLLNPGEHSVANSLAAIAVGLDLEIPFQTIAESLARFQAADRRFQILTEAAGVIVVDDYAHHPTEIRATLEAARHGWPDRRRIAVFQPHRFSRVQALGDEFHRCFAGADIVYVTPIYPAGEDPITGVGADELAAGIRRHGGRDVEFVPTLAEVGTRLLEKIRSGDMVLTLGAGDVGGVAHDLARVLEDRDRAAG
jgi:UDP-N-acetylmuramate--alanine ligase